MSKSILRIMVFIFSVKNSQTNCYFTLGLGLSTSRAEAGGVLFKNEEIVENKTRNCRLTRATQDNPTTRPIKKTSSEVFFL